jgi:hypothetical protein
MSDEDQGKWIAGRGYRRPGTGPRMRNPLLRVRRLLTDMLRSTRSRLSLLARPAGSTARQRRRSLIGSLVGAMESSWGRLLLVVILMQLAWMLASPTLR